MSTWSVLAIERLGTPLPNWPSIWGPLAGADPWAANGLRTVDLTPHLSPLQDFSQVLERDLTKASYGSVALDLVDADESLAVLLGPFSATLATGSRYYGPWIQITETWSSGSAVRWTGYLDETSIQWDQANALTRATVLHASQLLAERKLADLEELLRPYPAFPLSGSSTFTAATADALLHVDVPSFAPRADAVAQEAALWTGGQLSWVVGTASEDDKIWETSLKIHVTTTPFPPPAYPSLNLSIGGQAYTVDHIVWDSSIFAKVVTSDSLEGVETWTDTRRVARIVLQGYPDLTGILSLGATCTWGISEATRSHFALTVDVPAPVSGSDGQRWLPLNSVEQLVAGDDLSITFWDASQSVQRRSTLDVKVIDADGETNRAWLKEPLTQGLEAAKVLRIRRNSRDPVLFDGVAYAKLAVAPFQLDTTYLQPASTSRPVLAWLPHDVANPALYGLHNLQTVGGGALRLSRRGPARASDSTFPMAGCWEGSWASGWTWLGLPSASAPLEILGDLHQWPGGTNTARPPLLYIEGDLSAGATIPVNGFKHSWRTWKLPTAQAQDPDSWWNGTAIQWTSTISSAVIPALLMVFAAQTATPGAYSRQSGGTWNFKPHTGPGTYGSSSTPAITGSVPTGNWLALGMGIYNAGAEQEALLGLVTTDTAQPFTNMSAVLLSQALGGNLTVRQSLSLWNSGAIPAGNWALGGGLVVQTFTETIDNAAFPHTRLHKLDGTNHLSADFRTLEIIPQSIQPLGLTGAPGAETISGWYALALETYLTDSFAPARRLRFLWLGPALNLLNGDPEPDPLEPLDPTVNFRRGDLVSAYLPDGAVASRLVRTGTGDTMMGFFGGRLFQIDTQIPTTVERLKVGDPTTATQDASGLSVADYLERLATALLATAIPDANGNIRLVSRASGPLQTRMVTGGKVSVQATERGPRKTTQAWRGYISEVRVTFSDAVTGDSQTVAVEADHAGGKPLVLDMGDLACGISMARAWGAATAFWFGEPASVIAETWVDRTGGLQGANDPAWWSTWQVGDLVTFDVFTPTALVNAFKIHQFKPGPETRSVQVELLELPIQVEGV